MTIQIKKIGIAILMLFALTATSLMAQPGGGGGGGMGGGQGGGGERPQREGEGGQQRTMDLLASTGYFEIDAEEVVSKMRVKDDAKKTAIRAVVLEYTKGYETVGAKYKTEIAAIQATQKKITEAQSQGGDRTAMRTLMQESSESTTPVRTAMIELHKKLSEVDMPAALTEKELATWTKYYSTLCQSKGFRLNQPERRERGEGQQGQRQQRQQ